MFKKIVCATDFSPGSQQALQLAIHLAKDSEAELVIAHALYVAPHLGGPMPDDMWTLVRDEAERGLAAEQRRAVAAGVTRVSAVLPQGAPWVAITEQTKDPAVDLVVVGTHGRTAVSRFLLGSVAAQVVRHAECSVLVARGDAAAFHHVLCAVDFSDPSHEAMWRAGELAGESVTLFHAIELPWLIGLEPKRFDEMFGVHKRAMGSLEVWARELEARTRASVSTQIGFGAPAGETLAMLDADPKLDLVVVGSRGHTGIRRVLLGSVAERIVRHARAPVLVVRGRA